LYTAYKDFLLLHDQQEYFFISYDYLAGEFPLATFGQTDTADDIGATNYFFVNELVNELFFVNELREFYELFFCPRMTQIYANVFFDYFISGN